MMVSLYFLLRAVIPISLSLLPVVYTPCDFCPFPGKERELLKIFLLSASAWRVASSCRSVGDLCV